jgi:hypothetical protein
MRKTLKAATALFTLLGAVVCAAELPSPPAFIPAAPADVPVDPSADPPQAQVVPVQRDYDRFQDKTTLRAEGIRPTITRGDSRLFLTAVCSYDGVTVTSKPTKVQIEVLAVSDAYQFAEMKDDLQLIFLITKDPAAAAMLSPRGIPNIVAGQPAATQPNNVRRVRVPARFQKAGQTKDRTPKSLESFVAIVDADVLVQMATAPLVEGQLGGVEFKLGTMEQLSLRRFAEQVNLVAPLPTPDATALDRALANGPVRVDAVTLHLAQAKVDAAQENVDRLTTACLAKLEQSREYRTGVTAAEELEGKKDKTPVGPQRADVSQQWLEAKAKVGLMKSSALLEDTSIATAKRELADAQAALHSLQRLVPRREIRDAQR